MYTSFYAMNCNTFIKEENYKYPFKSNDYIETISRLNYIKEIKGIGVFYGENGFGKTYCMRNYVNSLNKDLYKVIYINATPNMLVFDFLNIIVNELSLTIGTCYKPEIIYNIQNEIKRIVNEDKMNIIVIIDDAHLLSKDILLNLRILYDFEIDSKDYISLILVGQEELKIELTKAIHSSLNQRINVNYKFNGLSRDEAKEYIRSRLERANTNKEIFNIEALNSLYSCSRCSIRLLNTLVTNCLMIGAQRNKITIDNEIVMLAKEETKLK